jgi:glucose-6-phosphate isomerase
MLLDLATGRLAGQEPISVRRLGELTSLFERPEAVADPDQVVYEIYGCPSDDTDEPALLYATTILHPGDVAGECFMTRGHFHTKPERGEFMVTLNGKGKAVLMDREGNGFTEDMAPGSIHNIDGRLAHRVANTGDEPLVFLVTWMSDCGHDYASIAEKGFSVRVRK